MFSTFSTFFNDFYVSLFVATFSTFSTCVHCSSTCVPPVCVHAVYATCVSYLCSILDFINSIKNLLVVVAMIHDV